jgi:hypothetical protein
MPKIKLQQKSPLYAEDKKKVTIKTCDMPECDVHALHRAPKDRALSAYYDFCFEHVKSYNRAWNYFAGMPDHDVEDYIYNGAIWDRPTWKFASEGAADDILRNAAWKSYHFTEKDKPKDRTHEQEPPNKKEHRIYNRNTPEHQALEEFGLAPPVTLAEIKKTYKSLLKKYHPDVNNSCPMAEERSKNINAAYTLLRLAYEKYEILEEKFKG